MERRDPALMANIHLRPLQPFLDAADTLEVCVNRPGEVFVETPAGWSVHAVPQLDFEHCLALAQAVANGQEDGISKASPLLAACLPGGHRAQFAIPPAVPQGTVSITIRKPSQRIARLSELAASGLFSRVIDAADGLQPHEQELLALRRARRFDEFLALAMQMRLTGITSGPTGAGKTYVMKALIEEISAKERLITIEDTQELLMPNHPNTVHLLYSAGGAGVSSITAGDLLKASLRMRGDRILLAELRDGVCLDFISAVASGHPGLTSVHGLSCSLVRERMALMIQQSAAGASMRLEQIRRLLTLTVDFIVQFDCDRSRGRFVREVWYEPERRLAVAAGADA